MQFLQLSLVISLRLTVLMRVLKIFRVLDLLRSSLSLVQIVGPKHLLVCLPYVKLKEEVINFTELYIIYFYSALWSIVT